MGGRVGSVGGARPEAEAVVGLGDPLPPSTEDQELNDETSTCHWI